MLNIAAYNPPRSKKADAAKSILEGEFRRGEERRLELVRKVSTMVIRDRLVEPAGMVFHTVDASSGPVLRLTYGSTKEEKPFVINRLALNQLAAKVKLPMTFVTHLEKVGKPWSVGLLADNLNLLYLNTDFRPRKKSLGDDVRFLHRLVGNELRGFLSRSYNRHLASAPLLMAFIEACDGVGAQPIDALASDVRFGLKCFLPIAFEPVPNEFIAVGLNWSNSDFGCGRLTVSLATRRISGGWTAVLEDAISKVHIGSVIEEADFELSDATAAKEVDTQASAIKDAVERQLSPEMVSRLIEAIQLAYEEEVPWSKLRGQLRRYLNREEMRTVDQLVKGETSAVDLPPVGVGKDGEPLPTKWWSTNLVGWLASRTADAERAADLQQVAGRMLGEVDG